MTARILATFGSLALSTVFAGCVSPYDVSIDVPTRAKLDVSSFQRVLVAGFIEAGSGEIDANVETVRLLRSQLRLRTSLRVFDGADILPLDELAGEKGADESAPGVAPSAWRQADPASHLKSEKDLEAYRQMFSDVTFWRQLGEEYQHPLIVTGTVLFTTERRSRVVRSDREAFDSVGRRSVDRQQDLLPSIAYILKPTFVFIDGRTGVVIYSESFREEVLYSEDQDVPALSTYFELMDRVLPDFLRTVSDQRSRETRLLLR